MSDEPRYTRTRTTITFGVNPPSWKAIGLLFLIGVVALAMLWAIIDLAMPLVGFDGKFGPGCDRGNPNCHIHSRGER